MNILSMALLWITVLTSSHASAQETIRITTGEYTPYLSENLEHNGVGLRIIREAFALEGVKVEYGFFPWKRSYKLVKSGKWDASATWGHNVERGELFYFSDPLYPAVSAFFHLKSFDFDWNTLNDLKELTIGATETYAYTPEFLDAIEKKTLNIELIDSDEVNFRKLLKGRTDIFPLNIDVAADMLANKFTQHERDLITYHERELYSIQAHLIFSKKVARNTKMLALFNNGLKRLKRSGKFNEYFKGIESGEYQAKIVFESNK